MPSSTSTFVHIDLRPPSQSLSLKFDIPNSVSLTLTEEDEEPSTVNDDGGWVKMPAIFYDDSHASDKMDVFSIEITWTATKSSNSPVVPSTGLERDINGGSVCVGLRWSSISRYGVLHLSEVTMLFEIHGDEVSSYGLYVSWQQQNLDVANKILAQMRNTSGANDCRLLCINSSQDRPLDHEPNPWEFYMSNASPGQHLGCLLNKEDVDELKKKGLLGA
ncbi:hypothetical protein L2E82_02024 [Cichorium intybus]|uniref:Uncharacterized protein n=2 Tax=Cichorium intybus TaxID=13427 RepID=A0ACB9H066_CICIN|nr:hypothetical protein L2E82_34362 [Cichorium intybus]KAI3789233.1 hypothetical protein L2E82_02024 [Cichorium intybus]